MTRSNLDVLWDYDNWDRSLSFEDGSLGTYSPDGGFSIDLTYSSALNLASKLLQWATNLPESEKGNVHRIDGEWVDVDNHPQH